MIKNNNNINDYMIKDMKKKKKNIKKKKKVLVKGFDQLPIEMKAYGHNVWIPVKRKQPSILLKNENILNRTIFYEGRL